VSDVVRIFPVPAQSVELKGLYLNGAYGPPPDRSRPFVYANFIASLDGRTSLPDLHNAQRRVPGAIANGRDWRLFQELAACADAVIVSGRHVRSLGSRISTRSFPVSANPEYADLLEWRTARGLAPQPAIVIVSASLDLPPLGLLVESGRTVYVATGEAAAAPAVERLRAEGVRMLVAGSGTRVGGRSLIAQLGLQSLRNIATIAGGEVLHALLVDDVLDRLYLTMACRLLGGASFDTLLSGPVLPRPAKLALKALHYDPHGAGVEQMFAIFDRDSAVERS
jgi:riboflavin biosynthesis pyrimidine reductase